MEKLLPSMARENVSCCEVPDMVTIAEQVIEMTSLVEGTSHVSRSSDEAALSCRLFGGGTCVSGPVSGFSVCGPVVNVVVSSGGLVFAIVSVGDPVVAVVSVGGPVVAVVSVV